LRARPIFNFSILEHFVVCTFLPHITADMTFLPFYRRCAVAVSWCSPARRRSFVTVTDIETAVGYPFQFRNKLHCRTLIFFTYRPTSELCRAVYAAPRTGGGRQRREVKGFASGQVQFTENQLMLTRSIVADVVDYQT